MRRPATCRDDGVSTRTELLELLPYRTGHFCLESGYHAEAWFELDKLFAEPARATELARLLAGRLAAYEPEVICGALTGGAFAALLLSQMTGKPFVYTARSEAEPAGAPFGVSYELPSAQSAMVASRRVVFVDDAISTGSATRGSVAALQAAGAEVAAVGAVVQFGNVGVDYLNQHNIPAETLVEHEYQTWHPSKCPLCRRSVPLEKVSD